MSAPASHFVGIAFTLASSVGAGAQAVLTDATPYGVGDMAVAMAAGDLDADGVLDLVTANSQTNDASILWGDGDGSFAPEVRLRGLTGNVRDVGVADFDDDGDLDLVFLLRQSASLLVLLRNDGTGSFGAPEPLGPTRSSFSLCVEDVDGDGDPDVTVATMGFGVDFLAAVFVNDGTGTFTLEEHAFESTSTLYLADVAVGDVDGDGHRDLVGVNALSDRVSLLRADGRGGFLASIELPVGAVNPFGVVLSDLDGDGDRDLLIAERLSGAPHEMLVATNDGAGSFSTVGTYPLAPQIGSVLHAAALAVADIDRDGRPDVVTADQVFFNLGAAQFTAPVPLGTGFAPATLALDIDDDGDADIVQAVYTNTFESHVAVLLNLTPGQDRSGPRREVPGGTRVGR